ncbi:hypothetical protein E8E11_009308 [Didymella keratinophila]|nr:hypothetical protein E8E11_009308 [Didymella keratinophila]
MLKKLLCAGTAILATASALPQAKKWYSLDQVARFDNIVAVPGVAVSPIGIYDDIFWQGMSLAQTGGLQNIAVVVPNSPPNVAAFSALDVATVTQGQPAMTVNYADSTIDHFSLKSFYYGCSSASQASVAALPVSCTVSIKGYADDKATQLIASQSFDFKVAVLQTNAQQLKADVNSKFKNLKRVDFFHVTVSALQAEHARDMYSLVENTKNSSLFDYLFDDSPASLAEFQESLTKKASATNPWFYSIVLNETSESPPRPVGYASLMRMDLTNRVIEVGNILFTSALQRTSAATEAMYLLARYVFEDLGFRRYEWKCNSLNTPSRRAAERFGFTYEGTFRQHMITRGRNRDTAWFSILDLEWPGVKRGFEAWLDASNFDSAGLQKRTLEQTRSV